MKKKINQKYGGGIKFLNHRSISASTGKIILYFFVYFEKAFGNLSDYGKTIHELNVNVSKHNSTFLPFLQRWSFCNSGTVLYLVWISAFTTSLFKPNVGIMRNAVETNCFHCCIDRFCGVRMLTDIFPWNNTCKKVAMELWFHLLFLL